MRFGISKPTLNISRVLHVAVSLALVHANQRFRSSRVNKSILKKIENLMKRLDMLQNQGVLTITDLNGYVDYFES